MADLVVRSAVQAFVFPHRVGDHLSEGSNDMCSPERAPSKAVFHVTPGPYR